MITPLGAPLKSVRIVEFEGLGPGPLAGRMLADMGAQVTVIVRPRAATVLTHLGGKPENAMRAGKSVTVLDLKQVAARDQALQMVGDADAVIEGNRPGVMERLGLGPADCAEINPRVVYGRMTGWGQDGPLAQAAGHDLNYVALTGLLALSAHRGERPIVPPTVLGDAGGALGLAFGLVCAVFDARNTGRGRVVDAAIVDIVAMMGGIAQWLRSSGQIDGNRPSALHDSPFYDVYRCSDGGYITLGALEPQFHALLLLKLGLHDVDPKQQYDVDQWPALKRRITALIASQSRAHWQRLLEGTDVCFASVLSLEEAAGHPHNLARSTYRRCEGEGLQAAPAPRFLELRHPPSS